MPNAQEGDTPTAKAVMTSRGWRGVRALFYLHHFNIKIFEMNMARYEHQVPLDDGVTDVCFFCV